MKVCFAIPWFTTTVGKAPYYIASRLVKDGHEVTFLTSDLDVTHKRLKGEVAELEGAKTIRSWAFKLFNKIIIPGQVLKLLFIRADVIYADGLGNPSSLCAALVGRLRGIPVVLRADWSGTRIVREGIVGIYDWLLKVTTLKNSDVILVFSKLQKESMIDQGVDAGKIEVWPNGVNYKEFSSGKNSGYLKKELCLPEHSKIILCVCRLTPGKNPELAIRVLAKVRREHKDTFLVIVGQKQEEDYYNYLNTLIKDLDLGDSVRFLFDVNHRNMPPVYASADVYFLPSKPVESMNLASMEAMCAGLPVVTTKVSITPKIIEEAKCGYAVDGEDDAAEKLIYLLEHESERRSMGEKGREYVSENLVWETLTGKLEEIMKTLSERK